MNWERRVRALERRAGLTGACRYCGGQGRGRIVMVLNGEEVTPPGGCPGCGVGHVWKRILMDLPVDGCDEQRCVITALARGPAAVA